ncbi:hypothetical protein HK102_006984, partial [Quaeritorhiza haematococci]
EDSALTVTKGEQESDSKNNSEAGQDEDTIMKQVAPAAEGMASSKAEVQIQQGGEKLGTVVSVPTLLKDVVCELKKWGAAV